MDEKRIILVVEDDVDIQQLLKIALQTRGYRVETAGNGVEGLEKLKHITPHLIILDLNMPKMGGLVFYQNICDKYNKPLYSILILTARANMTKLFEDLIIDGFKIKPFEVDELLDDIDQIINKKFGHVIRHVKVSGVKRPARVCFVDDEEQELKKVEELFVKAGYGVDAVNNGFDAIEYIYNNLPDIVLVKLSIFGVAGDVLISQLKRLSKTKDIKFILYTEKKTEPTVVLDKIGKKYGIDRFVHYTHMHQLLNAANELMAVIHQESPD